MSRARVLLAEPDTPTRTGIRLALTRRGFEIAAEARDAEGAVDAARRERPDIALVAADIAGDGINAARTIAAGDPAIKIVVLTSRQDGDELVAAVLAGASGYLGKDVDPHRLPLVLEGVLGGEAALPRRFTEDVLAALRGRSARRTRVLGRPVTDRQGDILNLLVEGRSTAEMARQLGISEVTARRHVSAAVARLGVADRAAAVKVLRGRSPE